MNNLHTHYDTLMVSRNASQEVIRAAFKSLCQKHHSDRNTHPDADRIMQQFNESYSILSDPIERSKYDRLLTEAERQSKQYDARDYHEYSKANNHSNRPGQKNRVVIINIPDSLSLKRAWENIFVLLSKTKKNITDFLLDCIFVFSSKIIPLLIKTIKIILCIAIFIALTFIVINYIKKSPNVENATISSEETPDNLEDIPVSLEEAQRQVVQAHRELDLAYDQEESRGYTNEASSYINDEIPKNTSLSLKDAQKNLKIAQKNLHLATNGGSLKDYESAEILPLPSVGYIDDTLSPSYKTHAPNGEPYPSSAGFIAGYPQLNQNGASILTVDNSQNSVAIFGKLYSLGGVKPKAVRHFYIHAGGGLNIRDISPGSYDVRYKELDEGHIAKSEPILLEEYEDYYGSRYSEVTMTLYKVVGGNMQTYSIPESEF